MKILDPLGNEITEYDKSRFYLVEEHEIIEKFDAVPETKEQGHYEEKENDKGHKYKKWIVDIPAKEGRPSWSKVKTNLRLTPFTEEQMTFNEEEKNKLRSFAEKDLQRRQKIKEKMLNKTSSKEVEELKSEITELKSLINQLLNNQNKGAE